MGTLLENLKQRLSAVWNPTVRFYRANSILVLSGFTILSVLLIVWARFGFTLQFGQSEAFNVGFTFKADKTQVDPNEGFNIRWANSVFGNPTCQIKCDTPGVWTGNVLPGAAPESTGFRYIESIPRTTTFTMTCLGQGSKSVTVKLSGAGTCAANPAFECATSCAQPRFDIGTCAGANFCCEKAVASSVTATLTVTPTSVRSGDTVQATWSSTNATTCAAVSGQNFNTNNAKSGNNVAVKINDSFVGTAQFRIRCDGANGAQGFSAIVPVTVTAPGGSGGGGGSTTKPSIVIGAVPATLSGQALGTISGTAADSVHVNTVKLVIRKNGKLDGTCTTDSKDWDGTRWITGCQLAGLITPTFTPGTSVTWTTSNTPPLSEMSAGEIIIFAGAWRDAYPTQPWSGWVTKTTTFQPATTTGPAAGVLIGTCTGGATPSITLKYSKLPPPGTTLPVNSNGMNKGTTPPQGVRTVEQLATFNPTDKGQYWEWTDTSVQSGYTYDYRAKYHPDVSTNVLKIDATPANCGSVQPPECTPKICPAAPQGCVRQQSQDVCECGAVLCATPPPGCFYQQVQCIQAPCDPVYVCPSCQPRPACLDASPSCDMAEPEDGWCATPAPTSKLSCAPVTQTVQVGRDAEVQASGGTGDYKWVAFQNGNEVDIDIRDDEATVRFSAVGTHVVQVTSGNQATSCRVTVVAASTETPAPATESLALVLTGRNVSTNSVPSDAVQVRTGQQVELRIQVANRFTSGNLNAVKLQVTLPDGLTYVAGSTTIRGAAAGSDTIIGDGLAIGGLGSGQDVLVMLRATAAAGRFPTGTTQVQATARASSSGVGDASDSVTLAVTRPSSGGGTGAVQTGPGEALLAAFLVSVIMTLLYVSYTHTSSYKRREVGTITRQRDPLDFRS